LSQRYGNITIGNVITYYIVAYRAERRSTKLLTPNRPGKGIVVALLFILGVVGVIGFNINPAYAAGDTSAVVGVVNYQLLLSQHPDAAVAQKTISEAAAQAKKDFDAQSSNMNNQAKQDLFQKLQLGLEQKSQALLGPINDKVMAAVKSVAAAKGLTVIVDKSNILYGGQDITDEVMKVITKK
jgi:outer membrane protein